MNNIKKNKLNYSSDIFENKNDYNFFIFSKVKKNLLIKIFGSKFVIHISKFKYFINLNVKGNLYLCKFDESNILEYIKLLQLNNINIHLLYINGSFINFKFFFEINIFDKKLIKFFLNFFYYFYLFYLILNLFLNLFFNFILVIYKFFNKN